MIYLSFDYIKKNVIKAIKENYVRPNNPAHNYLSEPEAIDRLKGCLERATWDYVQGVIPKASQLFLCINLGHFFLNGNKRLALTTLLSFILENGYGIYSEVDSEYRNTIKEQYGGWLADLFPDFEGYEDEANFTAEEFGFYNLTLAVLESRRKGCNHDLLKTKVQTFLEYSTISPEEIEDAGQNYLQNRRESDE